MKARAQTRVLLSVFGAVVLLSAASANALPPIRIWGDLSSSYGWSSSETLQQQETRKLASLKVNGLTYIWRPWFAMLRATSSFSIDQTESTNTEGESSQFMSGSSNVNLFPKSRFPFQFYVEKSDSRDDIEGFIDEYSAFRYGFSQQYRNLSNDLHVLANFDEATQSRSDEADEVGKNAQLSVSKRIGPHDLAFSANGNTSKSSEDNSDTDTYAVTGRHSYSKFKNFSVESLINNSGYSDANPVNNTELSVTQLSSFASWRPQDVESLSLSSSVRFQGTDRESLEREGVSTDQNDTLNAFMGAQYEFTPLISLSANVNGNTVKSEETDNYLLSETVGLSYHPDALEFTGYTYSASLGGSVTNQNSNVEDTQQISSNANHNLNKGITIDGRRVVDIGASQGLNTDNSFSTKPSQTLNHSFSLSWNLEVEDGSSVARLLLSDSRELSETYTFQLANFQFSRESKLNRYANLSGNLTLQASRQINEGGQDKTVIASGLLQYRHIDFFGVPRLKLTSELKVRSDTLSPSVDELIDNDRAEEILWKTDLDYRLGLFSTKLSTQLQSVNGKIDRAVQVKFTRVFGY